PRARRHRARDPRSQRPSAQALPLRPVLREQRLGRDRRRRAQPRAVDQPDRPPQRDHQDRSPPPPAAVPDPGTADAHQPAMDPPATRPLALATGLRRCAHTHPRAPRPHLTPPPGAHRHRSAAPAGNGQQPLPEIVTQIVTQIVTDPLNNARASHYPPINPQSTDRTATSALPQSPDPAIRWIKAKGPPGGSGRAPEP